MCSALPAALQGGGGGLVSPLRKVGPRAFIWLEQLAQGRAAWELLPGTETDARRMDKWLRHPRLKKM